MNIFQTVTRLREHALNRRDAFGHRLDEIRADAMLSTPGKVDLIAREFVAAQHDIQQDKSGEDNALRARRFELERALFGWDDNDAPAVLTARRDSNAYAEAIDNPRDALDAYETAKLRSDALHVHALFGRALERGWAAIVDDYLDEHPDREMYAQELAAIRQELDTHGRFMASMNYMLPKPSELAPVSLDEYERATASDPADIRSAFARQLRAV